MFSPKLVLSLRWVSMKRENDFFSRIQEEDIFVEILVWNLYHLLLIGPLLVGLCSRFSSSSTRLNIYYSARPVRFAMVFLKPTTHPPITTASSSYKPKPLLRYIFRTPNITLFSSPDLVVLSLCWKLMSLWFKFE